MYSTSNVSSFAYYPRWRSKTGSTNNCLKVTDTDVVPKPKWGNRANRMHTTSTDSVRHQCLKNIHHDRRNRKCNNLASFSDNNVNPNPQISSLSRQNILPNVKMGNILTDKFNMAAKPKVIITLLLLQIKHCSKAEMGLQS